MVSIDLGKFKDKFSYNTEKKLFTFSEKDLRKSCI